MPNGGQDRTPLLIQLAKSLQEARDLVAKLRQNIQDSFGDDPAMKPMVEALLATDTVDGKSLVEQVAGNVRNEVARKLWGAGVFVVIMLLLSAYIAFLFGGMDGAAGGGIFVLLGVATVIVLVTVAAGVLAIAALQSRTDFGSFWGNIEKVATSGAFYFFAGLALLLYAIHTTNSQEHPALTFLIAMLGVAIMLYGTGSQAAGAIATAGARLPDPSEATGIAGGAAGTADLAPDHPAVAAEASAVAVAKAADEGAAKASDAEKAAALPRIAELAKAAATAAGQAKAAAARRAGSGPSPDWGPVKANAAIAGGAAVLTALFSWGVIHYKSDIREVFGNYDRYAQIRIYACATIYDDTCVPTLRTNNERDVQGFSLNDYSVTAQTGLDERVYVYRTDDAITMIVFSQADSSDVELSIARLGTGELDVNSSGEPLEEKLDLSIPTRSLFRTTSGVATAEATDPECGDPGRKLVCVTTQREDRIPVATYSLNFVRGQSGSGVVRETAVNPATGKLNEIELQ